MSDIAHVIATLASSRRAVQLYPPTHPAHGEALDELVAAVRDATKPGPLVLNWHEGRLYHESIVIPEDTLGAPVVAEAFEVRAIESLTLHPEFAHPDAIGLTEVLALRPGPALDVEAELARRHATSVTVSLLEEDEERKERDRQREADRALYQRALAALRRLHERFVGDGVTDLSDSNRLVASLAERVMADPAAMLALGTIRSTGEHGLFHSLNVMIYALVLGERLGLPEEGLTSLGLAALLHDLGKAAFDEADPTQAEPMRALHPQVGAEILGRVALEDPAPMLVAYEHHMLADGSGWPHVDDDYVPHPYSRMVAIANRYENLTNGPDSSSMTPDKALVRILREAGGQLDPFFSRLFANALGVFPVGCLVRLSDQSVGAVVRGGDDPLAPVVRLAYDEKGLEIDDPDEIDLADSPISIVEVISPEALNVAVAEKL